MSARYVALLRGINVGKAKRIAMADLRDIVTGLGYTDVRTLLNSGNVVFSKGTARSAPVVTIAARIQKAIVDEVGISSRVTVLDAAELASIMDDNPLKREAESAPPKFLVAVPTTAKELARLHEIAKQDWKAESVALGPRAAYLWCADGILESKALETLGRAMGDAVTTRNWATMVKIRALFSDD